MLNNSEVDCDAILADKAGPPPFYEKELRIFLTLMLCIFPVVTVSGNALVIAAVATHKRLRTITNAFVVSLATADFTVAILVMPFGIYQQYNNKVWELGALFCKFTNSFDVMFTTSSIVHLSCLAVDRYLAICRPFLHERLNNRIIGSMLVGCWLVPIFISFIPIMNDWNLIGIEDFYHCAFPDNLACGFLVNATFSLVCSSIAFYIPAVLMIISNVKIFLAARTQAHHIRTLEKSLHKHKKGRLKRETKAAKTIVIIMGCFFVCWFPFFILNIIDPLIGYKIPYVPWTVALWLGYVNSMLNPLLYYKFNRGFRMAFQRLLNFKVCHGVSEFEDEYLSAANASDITHNGHDTHISNELTDLTHETHY